MSARKPWMLCPSAHRYAKENGVVILCGNDARHVCDGERTPYFWEAVANIDGKRFPWLSYEPCCGSCGSDEEYGYPYTGDACCCTPDNELSERAAIASAGSK